MSPLGVVYFIGTVIASCHASGIGHLVPAVKSIPIVRYAPFYNFPNAVRSIHAVAPPVPLAPALPAPAPLLPAPLPAPVLQTHAIPAPYLPAPAFAPAPAPLLPAPAPLLPAPAPLYPSPAPLLPAPAPVFPAPLPGPAFATSYSPIIGAVAPRPFIAPVLPKIAPAIPALPPVPVVGPTQFYRAVPALPSAPFTPIVRAVAPALPGPVFAPAAPVVAPAPIAVAKAIPYGVAPYASHFHHFGKFFSPAQYLPAPVLKQGAWK